MASLAVPFVLDFPMDQAGKGLRAEMQSIRGFEPPVHDYELRRGPLGRELIRVVPFAESTKGAERG